MYVLINITYTSYFTYFRLTCHYISDVRFFIFKSTLISKYGKVSFLYVRTGNTKSKENKDETPQMKYTDVSYYKS